MIPQPKKKETKEKKELERVVLVEPQVQSRPPEIFKYTEIHFRIFIRDILLNRCKISEKLFERCFNTDAAWRLINRAFVHKSASEQNYELLEFEGDPVVNLTTVAYIRWKFPDKTDLEWNTKVKHNLISGKILGRAAYKMGFGKYIKYTDPEIDEIFALGNESRYDVQERWISMLEDVLEALNGAIWIILASRKCSLLSEAYVVCDNFTFSFLEETKIDTTYVTLVDAKSRFKELLDQLASKDRKIHPEHYEINPHLVKSRFDIRRVIYTAKTFNLDEVPEHLKLNVKSTDTFISVGYDYGREKKIMFIKSGNSEKILENEIATDLLSLYEKRGLVYTKPAKKQPEFKDLDTSELQIIDPSIFYNAEFKKFISFVLQDLCKISKSVYEECFNQEEVWSQFQTIFQWNSNRDTFDLLEFVGDTILGLASVYYIRQSYPYNTNVNWNTKLKNYIAPKMLVAHSASAEGFSNFITHLFTQEGEESRWIKPLSVPISEVHSVVKALCGLIWNVLNAKQALGVGYVACNNLIFYLLNKAEIPTEYNTIADAVTRLKRQLTNLEEKKVYDGKLGVNEFIIIKETGILDQKFTGTGYYLDSEYKKHELLTVTGSRKDTVKQQIAEKLVPKFMELTTSKG